VQGIALLVIAASRQWLPTRSRTICDAVCADRDPISADAGTGVFYLEAVERQVQDTIKLREGD